jgi:hypothetical protein
MSEDHVASIFRVQEEDKQKTSMKQAGNRTVFSACFTLVSF